MIYQTSGDLNKAEQMQRQALEINERLGYLKGMATKYAKWGIHKQRSDIAAGRDA